jgi:hypothetical protein
MSPVSNSSGIFHDLFTPPPETQATTRVKDHVDQIAEYADTAEGSWDVFRVVDHALSYVKMLPSLTPDWLSVVEKVKEVSSSVGIGLSIPKIIADCNALRRSLGDLFVVQDLPYSDPERTRKIAQAAKKSFLDTIGLTWTVSQAALFIDNAKIFLFETTHLRIIDGINNVTSVISDGAELITEYFKLQHYHSPEAQPRNPAQATKLEQRKQLSWMTIAKDVASIGGAAIALVGIVFGIATQSIPVIAGTFLVLSTVWLTMKLASYFYNKIVVEAPIEQPSRLIAGHI